MNRADAVSLPVLPSRWKLRHAVLLAATLVLPLAGAVLGGADLRPLLAFPPRADLAAPEWSSPPAIAALAFALCCLGYAVRRKLQPSRQPIAAASRLPLWGAGAMIFTAAAWLVAWNRFDWAAPIQEHTFVPLWLGYIISVNALSHRRTGRCLLTTRPGFLLALFPVSAGFWWTFEYLNRYARNWIYLLPRPYTALEYALLATVSFSTVLPAVASTHELLSGSRLIDRFRSMWQIADSARRPLSAALGLSGTLILLLLPLFPHELYPGLWMGPLCLILALELSEPHPVLFPGLRTGDWRDLAAWTCAALVCGLFWEMWNFHSLAKWSYAIPYFGAARIFEMPFLGYAGYLPFGWECAAVISAAALLLSPRTAVTEG